MVHRYLNYRLVHSHLHFLEALSIQVDRLTGTLQLCSNSQPDLETRLNYIGKYRNRTSVYQVQCH